LSLDPNGTGKNLGKSRYCGLKLWWYTKHT
jgi:hypothetical protein